MRATPYLLPLLLAVTSGLAAQQPPAPCAAPEYRQFDFWAGTWNVFDPSGLHVGTNTIERTLGGCVLHEQWTSARGHRGFSYNTYDRTSGRWHQTWVDDGGNLLLIDGGLAGKAMIMRGTTTTAQGATVLNRITWTPVAADSVRQLWETSTDDGKTWSVAFDGMYVRQPGGGD
jgi:hypothetical protein